MWNLPAPDGQGRILVPGHEAAFLSRLQHLVHHADGNSVDGRNRRADDRHPGHRWDVPQFPGKVGADPSTWASPLSAQRRCPARSSQLRTSSSVWCRIDQSTIRRLRWAQSGLRTLAGT
jgi:hypothetical protein